MNLHSKRERDTRKRLTNNMCTTSSLNVIQPKYFGYYVLYVSTLFCYFNDHYYIRVDVCCAHLQYTCDYMNRRTGAVEEI